MLVAPVGPSQIAIYGGYRSRKLNDRYVFSIQHHYATKNQQQNDYCTYSVCKKMASGAKSCWSKKLTSVGNVSCMTKWGEFAAILMDDSGLNYFMTYRKERDEGVIERLSNIEQVEESENRN